MARYKYPVATYTIEPGQRLPLDRTAETLATRPDRYYAEENIDRKTGVKTVTIYAYSRYVATPRVRWNRPRVQALLSNLPYN